MGIPTDNRLYLGDKELSVVSYQLLVSVLEYQTAVMRRDFDTADRVLQTVPKEQRTRVAHFLEKQGFKKQALAVSSDPEHKFDLAIQLGDLETGYSLAKESASEQKWKQLAELATKQAGKNNVSFLSYFMLGELEKCLQVLLDSKRIPEAAFFARTYLPSEISRIVELWREQLSKVNERAGQSLADPKDYPNLFPEYN